MSSTPESLHNIVASVAEPMGYELVGVEYRTGSGGGALLRVYIDSPNGINVDDCAAVSRQLSALLDVEDPIGGAYDLEVSSPGLDRPLFKGEDFERYAGHLVKVTLREKFEGRRRYKGLLRGVEDSCVLVDVDGERWELPLELIDQARLVPEF
jgi:ribosome maturation factor RimP